MATIRRETIGGAQGSAGAGSRRPAQATGTGSTGFALLTPTTSR
jgi:hypothetical protein